MFMYALQGSGCKHGCPLVVENAATHYIGIQEVLGFFENKCKSKVFGLDFKDT